MNKTFKKAGITEKYFDTGKVKLNYVVGPPNGKPIVFIPGQGASWKEYSLLLPKLAQRFQVFALSLRGHGNSSKTPDHYTFNILGEDMTAFLRKIVGEPAIVGGNSLGGVLAIWLAANSPEWIKGVVCEDPPLFTCEYPLIKKTWVYEIFKLTSTPKKDRSLIRLLRDIKKIFPKEVRKHSSQVMGRKSFSILKGTDFDPTFSKAFVNGTAGEGFDHATALATIEQPILFLHARWFLIEGRILGALSDAEVDRVKDLVRGSLKYVKMNCGHAIPFEKPDEESKLIIDWVDENLSNWK